MLRRYVRAELSQTGEDDEDWGLEAGVDRSKGVRHVDRLTGRAGRVLCLIEAWIRM